MERDSFTAKRRAARSSTPFHFVLAASALFCLFLVWHSRLFVFHTHLVSSPQRAGHFAVQPQLDSAQVVLAPADKVMVPRSISMPLRIITYNIRYATDRQVGDEQPWKVRAPKVYGQMRFITAGHENPFLCLQEVLHAQVLDIQAGLGPSWAFIGRGRGDGEADSEFSPIFYRSDTWKCMRSQTRWLSPTPDVPSRGWDASHNRVVTMGEFLHNETGTSVIIMNTHFDHVGGRARSESAKLIIKYAEAWRAGDATNTDTPPPSALLVAGDFNSAPDDEAYKVMTAPGSGMSDIAQIIPPEEHYGNNLTYTSFGEPNEPPQLIDFLFIQEPRTAKINTYGVLANKFDDGLHLSDHRPVVADLDVNL